MRIQHRPQGGQARGSSNDEKDRAGHKQMDRRQNNDRKGGGRQLHERLSRKQPRRGGTAWRLHKVVEEGGFD